MTNIGIFMSPIVSASVLSCDFSILRQEVIAVQNAGSSYIHFDVMDGVFVPNLTFGTCVIKSLRNHVNIPFDVHLMTSQPDHYIPQFAQAGSDIITFHLEASLHPHRTIQLIKSLNKKAGISIIPSTPISSLEHLIEYVDLVLIMTVNPGFGGQSLIKSQLNKIYQCRALIDKHQHKTLISVDGGVNSNNAKALIDAGANILVAGQHIFGGKDYKKQIISLLK